MRKLAVALLWIAPAFAQNSVEQIRKVLDDQVAAWNRGDIPAFMDGYEDSESTAFVSSSVIKGRAKVLARYRERYGSREKMGTLKFTDLEVRLLGRDHASAIGRFHLTRSAEGGGDASGLFTLLFRRTPEGWKIILDHTS